MVWSIFYKQVILFPPILEKTCFDLVRASFPTKLDFLLLKYALIKIVPVTCNYKMIWCQSFEVIYIIAHR